MACACKNRSANNIQATKVKQVVKSKYAYVTYNGQTRKIEYSPKTVAGILDELAKDTSQFEIEPVGRSGVTDTMILVTTFKNCVK